MRDLSVRPEDNAASFAELLDAYFKTDDGSLDRESRMGQFIAKCALCSEADWQLLGELLENLKISPDVVAYIREAALVSRLFIYGSDAAHRDAVGLFAKHYPNDTLLSVPIYWPKGE